MRELVIQLVHEPGGIIAQRDRAQAALTLRYKHAAQCALAHGEADRGGRCLFLHPDCLFPSTCFRLAFPGSHFQTRTESLPLPFRLSATLPPMDVHPPHQPLHTWRDFFIHIATIVVGLLIAIGLEQSVEWIHHRHLVHTAEENLREEAETNVQVLERDQHFLLTVHRAVSADLETLRILENKPDAKVSALTASWSWNGLTDSAYITARDTGALALMPYNEVQAIDALYAQQQYVNHAAEAYILAVSRIRMPLQGGRNLGEIRPEKIRAMANECSGALVDMELLGDMMRPMDTGYKRFSSK